MAVFRGEAEDLFAYYRCTDAETPQEFAAYVDACKDAALYETGRVGCLWGQADYAVHLR